jgi:hypothetical protein
MDEIFEETGQGGSEHTPSTPHKEKKPSKPELIPEQGKLYHGAEIARLRGYLKKRITKTFQHLWKAMDHVAELGLTDLFTDLVHHVVEKALQMMETKNVDKESFGKSKVYTYHVGFVDMAELTVQYVCNWLCADDSEVGTSYSDSLKEWNMTQHRETCKPFEVIWERLSNDASVRLVKHFIQCDSEFDLDFSNLSEAAEVDIEKSGPGSSKSKKKTKKKKDSSDGDDSEFYENSEDCSGSSESETGIEEDDAHERAEKSKRKERFKKLNELIDDLQEMRDVLNTIFSATCYNVIFESDLDTKCKILTRLIPSEKGKGVKTAVPAIIIESIPENLLCNFQGLLVSINSFLRKFNTHKQQLIETHFFSVSTFNAFLQILKFHFAEFFPSKGDIPIVGIINKLMQGLKRFGCFDNGTVERIINERYSSAKGGHGMSEDVVTADEEEEEGLDFESKSMKSQLDIYLELYKELLYPINVGREIAIKDFSPQQIQALMVAMDFSMKSSQVSWQNLEHHAFAAHQKLREFTKTYDPQFRPENYIMQGEGKTSRSRSKKHERKAQEGQDLSGENPERDLESKEKIAQRTLMRLNQNPEQALSVLQENERAKRGNVKPPEKFKFEETKRIRGSKNEDPNKDRKKGFDIPGLLDHDYKTSPEPLVVIAVAGDKNGVSFDLGQGVNKDKVMTTSQVGLAQVLYCRGNYVALTSYAKLDPTKGPPHDLYFCSIDLLVEPDPEHVVISEKYNQYNSEGIPEFYMNYFKGHCVYHVDQNKVQCVLGTLDPVKNKIVLGKMVSKLPPGIHEPLREAPVEKKPRPAASLKKEKDMSDPLQLPVVEPTVIQNDEESMSIEKKKEKMETKSSVKPNSDASTSAISSVSQAPSFSEGLCKGEVTKGSVSKRQMIDILHKTAKECGFQLKDIDIENRERGEEIQPKFFYATRPWYNDTSPLELFSKEDLLAKRCTHVNIISDQIVKPRKEKTSSKTRALESSASAQDALKSSNEDEDEREDEDDSNDEDFTLDLEDEQNRFFFLASSTEESTRQTRSNFKLVIKDEEDKKFYPINPVFRVIVFARVLNNGKNFILILPKVVNLKKNLLQYLLDFIFMNNLGLDETHHIEADIQYDINRDVSQTGLRSMAEIQFCDFNVTPMLALFNVIGEKTLHDLVFDLAEDAFGKGEVPHEIKTLCMLCPYHGFKSNSHGESDRCMLKRGKKLESAIIVHHASHCFRPPRMCDIVHTPPLCIGNPYGIKFSIPRPGEYRLTEVIPMEVAMETPPLAETNVVMKVPRKVANIIKKTVTSSDDVTTVRHEEGGGGGGDKAMTAITTEIIPGSEKSLDIPIPQVPDSDATLVVSTPNTEDADARRTSKRLRKMGPK